MKGSSARNSTNSKEIKCEKADLSKAMGLSSASYFKTVRKPVITVKRITIITEIINITISLIEFDLKKKFSSAPTITKLKIWERQILSRFLDGPNKFCQSSASGPLSNKQQRSINYCSSMIQQ